MKLLLILFIQISLVFCLHFSYDRKLVIYDSYSYPGKRGLKAVTVYVLKVPFLNMLEIICFMLDLYIEHRAELISIEHCNPVFLCCCS